MIETVKIGDDWVKYTANILNDKRYKRAQKDLGIQALGLITFLFLKLRIEKDYKYAIADIDLLADEANVSLAIMQTIINSYSLFDVDENNEYFSSQILRTWMESYDQMRLKNKKAGKISASKRKQASNKRLEALKLSQTNSSQHSLNTCLANAEEVEVEVEGEVTTTIHIEKQNSKIIAQKEAFALFQSKFPNLGLDDFKTEFLLFKAYNENESKRTVENWKRWLIQLKKHTNQKRGN